MEGARIAGSTLTEEEHEGLPGQQPGNSRSQTGKEHTDQNTASSTEAYQGKQGQVTLHHKMNCAYCRRSQTHVTSFSGGKEGLSSQGYRHSGIPKVLHLEMWAVNSSVSLSRLKLV